MSYDPLKIRPNRNFILVLMDQRKEKVGSIILPGQETGVEKVTEGAGTIIRVGSADAQHKLGLEEGMRIVYRSFLKHANPVDTDEVWGDGSHKEYFLMSSDDVIAIIPPGMEVGVFSGRPQVPERR